ncbi:MAG: MerR family transcriptional regulator [Alphaproteobacteria bacterium]|nr:MerR family transcriptional regulator [Alphaproteobacteria bacterium]
MMITINHVSKITGFSAKMIRHYEKLGLLGKITRTSTNYRIYKKSDIDILHFIKRTKNLGFATEDIKILLNVWQNKKTNRLEVRHIALKHLDDLKVRIHDLQLMVNVLQELITQCEKNKHTDCPILASFIHSHS